MEYLWSNIVTSIEVTAAATALAVLIGLPIAWRLARGQGRGRRALDILVTLPLVLPPTVLGYYLLLLLGRNGPVGRLTEAIWGRSLLFSIAAAVLASAAVSLPLFVQAARNAFEGVPKDLIESAAIDGAGRRQTFRYVDMPLATPGIVIGVLLAAARSLGEFGATLMVAGNIPGRTQTLSLAIYAAVQSGRYDRAHLLAGVLVAASSLGMWIALRWRGKRLHE